MGGRMVEEMFIVAGKDSEVLYLKAIMFWVALHVVFVQNSSPPFLLKEICMKKNPCFLGVVDLQNGLGWEGPHRPSGSTPLPWAGTPSPSLGCSQPRPTWPWALPGRGQPQLLGAAWARASPPWSSCLFPTSPAPSAPQMILLCNITEQCLKQVRLIFSSGVSNREGLRN